MLISLPLIVGLSGLPMAAVAIAESLQHLSPCLNSALSSYSTTSTILTGQPGNSRVSFDHTHPTTSCLATSSSSTTTSPVITGQPGNSRMHSSPTTARASVQATPTTDPATLQDINTIHVRRLPFIVSTVSNSSVASIPAWLSTLGANGKWPDSEVDYTTGCDAQRANWPAEDHWNRIVTFSAAYHGGVSGGAQYVNTSSLRGSITRAMDYWFSNDFATPGCLNSGGSSSCPCGTPGFWNTNWFSNVIGIPSLVGQSCLLLNDTLTKTQLGNCSKIQSRAYGTVSTQTGANTLDVASIGIDLGLLTVNVSLVTDAFKRVHNEVVVQQAIKADGIRPDGSFSQHSGIIYNGNYGKDYTNDVLALEIEAGGTQFAAAGASRNAFVSLIDGDQWMIYRNVLTGVLHWDFSVLGRFISFPVIDNQATGGIKINLTQVLTLGQSWNSSVMTDVYNHLSDNSTDANAGQLNGNRMFFDNDYMVQRGDGYVTTLRMFSSRTQNSECVNAENPLGFHLSDGTVYTYQQGNEYEDISAAWDWNLIPGTTVDYGATPLTCATVQWTGVESFAGGASNGVVGIGAMRYTNPSTRSLSWQKAWVFLEGIQHVMINNIKSQTSAPVFSILDQRRHAGDVLVNGVARGSGNYSNATALWHGGVGYTFPAGSAVSVSVGMRTGSWSAIGISTQPPATVDLFAAWLSHKVVNASASYNVYPAVDYDEFVSKSKVATLQELRNDATISAVYDSTHQTAAIVFWVSTGGQIVIPQTSPAAPITVQSNRGLAVIVSINTLMITISDPSQTFSDAQVTITLGSGGKPNGWGTGQSRQLSFSLPTSGLAGSSVSKSFA